MIDGIFQEFLPAMPTSEDIFRAFSRDFFSKLLATPK
jgi:hypothetical protein